MRNFNFDPLAFYRIIFFFLLFLKQKDELIPKLIDCSEEGKKVVRNKGKHFVAVFKRIEDSFI